MKFRVLIAVAIMVAASSCDAVRQVASSTYNMVNCKYDYNSISSLSVAGINLSNGVRVTDIPRVVSLLGGNNTSSLPLDFTLNLDVENPNSTAAALSGLQYILSIDGIQFTTGSVNQALNIAPGGKQVMPLQIGLDLASLLKGESADAVVNIVKNFVGIGSEKSNVSFQIRPSFQVAGHTVTSPVYIPVNFAFGGKK